MATLSFSMSSFDVEKALTSTKGLIEFPKSVLERVVGRKAAVWKARRRAAGKRPTGSKNDNCTFKPAQKLSVSNLATFKIDWCRKLGF